MNQITKTVRHFVAFRYNPGTTTDQIRQIEDAFCALPIHISGIVSMEHGVNNSPEKLNHGFTHAYLLTFEDATARDEYLPHPAHAAFGQLLKELQAIADVFVFDYHATRVH